MDETNLFIELYKITATIIPKLMPDFVDLLLIAFICIVAIAIILMLAKLKAYFTTVDQETTVFINSGDNLRDIWPNITGYDLSSCVDLDGHQWLIPKEMLTHKKAMFQDSLIGTRLFQRWLWNRFGVRFISWFWPHVHVHAFDIRKGGRRHLKSRSDIEGDKGKGSDDAPLKLRIEDSKETEVESLLFLSPRPIYIEGIELAGDSSRINLLILVVLRQVIPALPVYGLRGDFYMPIDAAIEAAMVDFFAKHRVAVKEVRKSKDGEPEKEGGNGVEIEFVADHFTPDDSQPEVRANPLTYGHWIKMGKGDNSPLESSLRQLNITPEYLQKLRDAGGRDELVRYAEKELLPHYKEPIDAPARSERISGMIPNGIVPRFGLALVSFRVVEWEAHSSTVEFANAFLASEKERQFARGAREKAYGQRDALMAIGKGDASGGEQFINMLIEKGVDPNIAAQVLETKLRAGSIGGEHSKITTYVEGGGKAMITIPTDSKVANRPPESKKEKKTKE